LGDSTCSNATAGLALWVIGINKPIHSSKVEIP
jgi:hypothetical protein